MFIRILINNKEVAELEVIWVSVIHLLFINFIGKANNLDSILFRKRNSEKQKGLKVWKKRLKKFTVTSKTHKKLTLFKKQRKSFSGVRTLIIRICVSMIHLFWTRKLIINGHTAKIELSFWKCLLKKIRNTWLKKRVTMSTITTKFNRISTKWINL